MATVAVKLQNNTTRDWDRGTYGAPVLFEANIVTFFVLLAQVLRTMETDLVLHESMQTRRTYEKVSL